MQASPVRIPRIACAKGGLHNNELINQVCLEKGCVDRGEFLLCMVCAEQEHAQHNHIPAKVLLQEIMISLSG
jgi:hypothetical protein